MYEQLVGWYPVPIRSLTSMPVLPQGLVREPLKYQITLLSSHSFSEPKPYLSLTLFTHTPRTRRVSSLLGRTRLSPTREVGPTRTERKVRVFTGGTDVSLSQTELSRL